MTKTNDPAPSEGFSPAELRMLTSVLDVLIPANPAQGLPGAGALGLATAVDTSLARTPMLRPMIADGLLALGKPTAPRVADFLDAEPGFVMSLLFHAYAAYYGDARVLTALGLEARPPHPRGYELRPIDPALLDPVRRRPKMYRRA